MVRFGNSFAYVIEKETLEPVPPNLRLKFNGDSEVARPSQNPPLGSAARYSDGRVAEIAAITGHSMRDVGAILDKYLARTDKIALAAIAKLERGKR